jgi:hypothetical protein
MRGVRALLAAVPACAAALAVLSPPVEAAPKRAVAAKPGGGLQLTHSEDDALCRAMLAPLSRYARRKADDVDPLLDDPKSFEKIGVVRVKPLDDPRFKTGGLASPSDLVPGKAVYRLPIANDGRERLVLKEDYAHVRQPRWSYTILSILKLPADDPDWPAVVDTFGFPRRNEVETQLNYTTIVKRQWPGPVIKDFRTTIQELFQYNEKYFDLLFYSDGRESDIIILKSDFSVSTVCEFRRKS